MEIKKLEHFLGSIGRFLVYIGLLCFTILTYNLIKHITLGE